MTANMNAELGNRICMWCGNRFRPRGDGGKPQVFCRPACRRAFDAAGRRWVAEAVAGGTLTLDSLRNGAAATRALLPEAVSPASYETAPQLAPIAPAARPGEAMRLLAVQSEGWHALAAAVSQELFDRLKCWHATRSVKKSAAGWERR
jgi:hypothetical protein